MQYDEGSSKPKLSRPGPAEEARVTEIYRGLFKPLVRSGTSKAAAPAPGLANNVRGFGIRLGCMARRVRAVEIAATTAKNEYDFNGGGLLPSGTRVRWGYLYEILSISAPGPLASVNTPYYQGLLQDGPIGFVMWSQVSPERRSDDVLWSSTFLLRISELIIIHD